MTAMEKLAKSCQHKDIYCVVYAHPSVPEDRLYSLFLDTLVEFPLLRAIPDYNLFWKEII